MAVINFLKSLRETIWEMVEENDQIMELADSKILKRVIGEEDIDPGQCPFLSGWFLSPGSAWFAGQSDRYDLNWVFFGAFNANDREDFDSAEEMLVALSEMLRTDLIAPASQLRQQGGVIVYTVEGSEIGYFEDRDSEEGASYVELSIKFTVQNPNA